MAAVWRYITALAAFGLVLLLTFALPRLTGLSLDLTALIILVMIASVWYLGREPDLLVAVVFEAALLYFAAALSPPGFRRIFQSPSISARAGGRSFKIVQIGNGRVISNHV